MSLAQASHPRTQLLFHHDGTLYEHNSKLLALPKFEELDASDQALIKPGSVDPAPTHAAILEATIFHPQGGGQPSDIGSMSISPPSNDSQSVEYVVSMVRHSVTNPALVLHFGHFQSSPEPSLPALPVESKLAINQEKRLFYSKLHTAGHVLGSAVRKLLQDKIEGFDELKASHFPDSAACEFHGLIQGSEKEGIQKQVDQFIDEKLPVEIDFWSRDDFRDHGLERLIPKDSEWNAIAETNGELKGKIRIVNIVGADIYPCGGTHVPDTASCGKVRVRKIGRQKGTSRVAYAVD